MAYLFGKGCDGPASMHIGEQRKFIEIAVISEFSCNTFSTADHFEIYTYEETLCYRDVYFME